MPSQTASELLEEFSAISEFIESGETPSRGDRHNAVSLWGKMVAKINSGPGACVGKYRADRAALAAGLSFEDKDGKAMPVARFDHEVVSLLEVKEKGRTAVYHSAVDMVERLERCIAFLEFWLKETAPVAVKTIGSLPTEVVTEVLAAPPSDPAPKKTKKRATIVVDEPTPVTPTTPSEPTPVSRTDELGDAPAEETKPMSSFQKILSKAQ